MYVCVIEVENKISLSSKNHHYILFTKYMNNNRIILNYIKFYYYYWNPHLNYIIVSSEVVQYDFKLNLMLTERFQKLFLIYSVSVK